MRDDSPGESPPAVRFTDQQERGVMFSGPACAQLCVWLSHRSFVIGP
jgi:hypothetical protein